MTENNIDDYDRKNNTDDYDRNSTNKLEGPFKWGYNRYFEIVYEPDWKFENFVTHSAAHKPYLGITIHWIDTEFRPQECDLALATQPYPHMAQQLHSLFGLC